MVEFKRKLYRRGSSFETTVPMPILFDKDISKKHIVKFLFDSERKKWYLEVEEEKDEK